MRNVIRFTTPLFAALALTTAATAQSTQPAANAPAEAQQQVSSEQPAPAQDTPHTAPVFWISSVEILRSAHGPQLDVIRVRGLVTTEGWESAELVPLTKGTPADGVLDLAMVAEAPADNTTPTQYQQIESIFVLEPGHPFNGVRVHGSANRVAVKALPGYVESAAPPRDCTQCTGKYFLRKGEAVPAGRKADAVVREEDLPRNLRVIRESDGIGTLESNPNRMTLLLNETGDIVSAMWD
jgi:hypothetical protein